MSVTFARRRQKSGTLLHWSRCIVRGISAHLLKSYRMWCCDSPFYYSSIIRLRYCKSSTVSRYFPNIGKHSRLLPTEKYKTRNSAVARIADRTAWQRAFFFLEGLVSWRVWYRDVREWFSVFPMPPVPARSFPFPFPKFTHSKNHSHSRIAPRYCGIFLISVYCTSLRTTAGHAFTYTTGRCVLSTVLNFTATRRLLVSLSYAYTPRGHCVSMATHSDVTQSD